MLREGTLDDIARAAALRQRAWPESIVTEEGMRHWLAGIPSRAGHTLLAWEDAGELLGWAHAGRSWWHADPAAGMLSLTVDPSRRGEGMPMTLRPLLLKNNNYFQQ